MVGVAQLVRALGCGPGGRGFEPRHPPHDEKESGYSYDCYREAIQSVIGENNKS